MTVYVTKPAVNLREELANLKKPTGIVGESILRADTAAEAVEQLNLEDHTFTTFTSTGIDDNATSTALTIGASNNVGIGTTSPTSNLDLVGSTGIYQRHSSGGRLVFDDSDTADASTPMSYISNTAGALQFGRADRNASTGLTTNSVESMRINSSGTLLVAKASPGIGTVGHQIQSNGLSQHTADGSEVLQLNRLTSDGVIAQFRKDSTIVGSIGSNGGDVYLGTGVAGVKFADANPSINPHNTSTNATSDNAIDLGTSSARFKDLYLSGGVYLGGTGAANHLDDYEEGTFTPTTDGDATGVLVAAEGYYTKVGRLVAVEIVAQVGTNFTSSSIGGLPFTVANLATASSVAQNTVALTSATPSEPVFAAASEATNSVLLYVGSTASTHAPNTTQALYRIMLSYMTT